MRGCHEPVSFHFADGWLPARAPSVLSGAHSCVKVELGSNAAARLRGNLSGGNFEKRRAMSVT